VPPSSVSNKLNKQSESIVSQLNLTAPGLFARLTLSTLKMEVVSSSEISLDFYQIVRRHIPEDSTLCPTSQ
jgi:hypothetical protein